MSLLWRIMGVTQPNAWDTWVSMSAIPIRLHVVAPKHPTFHPEFCEHHRITHFIRSRMYLNDKERGRPTGIEREI